jgi:hypothetical protein
MAALFPEYRGKNPRYGSMTYRSLLSAIYTDFDRLLPGWEAEREKAGSIGVFAFLPYGYAASLTLTGSRYTYWPISRVGVYLESVGLTDDGYLDLLEGFAFGQEFLVMIVEFTGEREKLAVHIHKITRVGVN